MRFEATKSSTIGTAHINIVGHVENDKKSQCEIDLRAALPNVRYSLEPMMHGHDVPAYPEFNMIGTYSVAKTTKTEEQVDGEQLRPGYDAASINVLVFSGDCQSIDQLVTQYRYYGREARNNLGSLLSGLGLSPIQIAEHLVFFDKYVLGLDEQE